MRIGWRLKKKARVRRERNRVWSTRKERPPLPNPATEQARKEIARIMLIRPMEKVRS